MKKRNALGSGLSELLGDVESVYDKAFETYKAKQVYQIKVALIQPNPMQPRQNFDEDGLKELAQSIKEHGLLQPIILCKNKEDNYTLIAGERRLRAAKLLKLDKIDSLIVDTQEHKMRELALIENIQRENLNAIELALSYQALITEHSLTHEQLAQKIQKSRTHLTNTLRLLELSKETQHLIKEGKITQGHAKILIGLTPENEKIAVQTILGQKLNVRNAEKLAKSMKRKHTIKLHANYHTTQNLFKQLKSILHSYNISLHVLNDKEANLSFQDIKSLESLIKKLQ